MESLISWAFNLTSSALGAVEDCTLNHRGEACGLKKNQLAVARQNRPQGEWHRPHAAPTWHRNAITIVPRSTQPPVFDEVPEFKIGRQHNLYWTYHNGAATERIYHADRAHLGTRVQKAHFSNKVSIVPSKIVYPPQERCPPMGTWVPSVYRVGCREDMAIPINGRRVLSRKTVPPRGILHAAFKQFSGPIIRRTQSPQTAEIMTVGPIQTPLGQRSPLGPLPVTTPIERPLITSGIALDVTNLRNGQYTNWPYTIWPFVYDSDCSDPLLKWWANYWHRFNMYQLSVLRNAPGGMVHWDETGNLAPDIVYPKPAHVTTTTTTRIAPSNLTHRPIVSPTETQHQKESVRRASIDTVASAIQQISGAA